MRESNPQRCARDGLATRAPCRWRIHRVLATLARHPGHDGGSPCAGDGTRTRAVLADNEVLLPLSYASMRPSCLSGHGGQPRYRTAPALFARQRCTPVRRPPRANARPRTGSSRLRVACTSSRAASAWVVEPVTRLERAVSALQERRRSRPAPPARCPRSRRESNAHVTSTSAGASAVGQRGREPQRRRRHRDQCAPGQAGSGAASLLESTASRSVRG